MDDEAQLEKEFLTKEGQRKYEDWLSERPVDWQRFKNEEYYAMALEDAYMEEMMMAKYIKEND